MIKKYFNEAKTNLENFEKIGLIDIKNSEDELGKEFYLNENLYPALQEVLEEVFGKENIAKAISRAKFFKDREPRNPDLLKKKSVEVKE